MKRKHNFDWGVVSELAPHGLTPQWNFKPSTPAMKYRLIRAVRLYARRRFFPPHRVLMPVTGAERWTAYFAYIPDGKLLPSHCYTLDKLAAEPGRLLVICATDSPDQMPAELRDRVDSLIWKGRSGFDFSAYALALRYIALNSNGADVAFLNDSVLGPFQSLADLFAGSPWDLTGLTAYSLIENHVQSYAFQIRNITPQRVRALSAVFPQRSAFDRYKDVVLCQETRLARVAARSMSVGALWFADAANTLNPTVYRAVELARAGFPFFKRSLTGRFAHLADRAEVDAFLVSHGHPLEMTSAT